jgi:hypothetical protein
MTLPVVVLPQPDSPTKPKVSPWRMTKRDVADGVHVARLASNQPVRTHREELDDVAQFDEYRGLAEVRRDWKPRAPRCSRARRGWG